ARLGGGDLTRRRRWAQPRGPGGGRSALCPSPLPAAMLTPPLAQVSPTSSAARGPFYTSVGLVLNGDVRAGDVWKLGINNQDISYTAATNDDLTDVADGIAGKLGSQYTTHVDTTTDPVIGLTTVTLRISNSNGFSLSGLTLTGL